MRLGLALTIVSTMAGPALAHGVGQTTAAGQSADVAKVVAELDTASSRFKSAQAEFSWDVYTAAVLDHEIQSGTIYFERRNGTTQMAAYIHAGGGGEAAKIVLYDGDKVQLYTPAIKQMIVVQAGSHQAQAEAFLTLGFGGSGKSLIENWEVAVLGKEKIGGLEVTKLDLKPKAPNIQNLFTHVTIWVDTDRGISVKQIFYEAGGDQRTDIFSNIQYNQPIPPSMFKIKVAPGTTVQNR